jgi:hypothetical protein
MRQILRGLIFVLLSMSLVFLSMSLVLLSNGLGFDPKNGAWICALFLNLLFIYSIVIYLFKKVKTPK